jgi:hypothetical protein
MIALAIVLGLAVADVKAQEHGAKADAHGAKAEAHPAKAEAPAAKTEEKPVPAAEAPPGNFARSAPDLVALAERIHKRIAEVRSEAKGKGAAARSGKPEESRGESSAAARQSRVQLDWRVPMITWPDELLQPEGPSTR